MRDRKKQPSWWWTTPRLTIQELKKGGFNPEYERVETAQAMKNELLAKQWDIILKRLQNAGLFRAALSGKYDFP